MAKQPTRRCAIYTRKSSEEGLEQAFNSLHAQREACEAFIRSQQGEGWRVVEAAYDDGGLSGGTMERPALQRLLQDIGAGRIDIVVVYKVDRLTRSLMDFAKIVSLFDRHNVSFVAVTQQFNTTSSMGRLTLNILLSFAQFEREVTGERIRDKIAASKRKGMWMGGVTPLGYDVRNRKLVVNEAEAASVCLIYRRYRELGSVRLLKDDLDRRGIRSKRRTHLDGAQAGGMSFARGALYALLSNPIYIGEIAHKGVRYPGQHDAIVDRPVWDAVQEQLRENGAERGDRAGKVAPSPLAGKLFDEAGGRLTPTHARKAAKRYRYYVSQQLVTGASRSDVRGWRLPAAQIETIVAAEAARLLANHGAVAATLEKAGLPASRLPPAFAAAGELARQLQSETDRASALATIIDRIELRAGSMGIAVSLVPLVKDGAGSIDADMLIVTRDIPMHMKRRGVEARIIVESGAIVPVKADPILLKEVARARRCFDALVSGAVRSVEALAAIEGVSDRYISSLLPLAFLAPDIVEAIVGGTQPVDLTAKMLIRRIDLPTAWQGQRLALGFR
jgi:site-specific DNA recombinase